MRLILVTMFRAKGRLNNDKNNVLDITMYKAFISKHSAIQQRHKKSRETEIEKILTQTTQHIRRAEQQKIYVTTWVWNNSKRKEGFGWGNEEDNQKFKKSEKINDLLVLS